MKRPLLKVCLKQNVCPDCHTRSVCNSIHFAAKHRNARCYPCAKKKQASGMKTTAVNAYDAYRLLAHAARDVLKMHARPDGAGGLLLKDFIDALPRLRAALAAVEEAEKGGVA